MGIVPSKKGRAAAARLRSPALRGGGPGAEPGAGLLTGVGFPRWGQLLSERAELAALIGSRHIRGL